MHNTKVIKGNSLLPPTNGLNIPNYCSNIPKTRPLMPNNKIILDPNIPTNINSYINNTNLSGKNGKITPKVNYSNNSHNKEPENVQKSHNYNDSVDGKKNACLKNSIRFNNLSKEKNSSDVMDIDQNYGSSNTNNQMSDLNFQFQNFPNYINNSKNKASGNKSSTINNLSLNSKKNKIDYRKPLRPQNNIIYNNNFENEKNENYMKIEDQKKEIIAKVTEESQLTDRVENNNTNNNIQTIEIENEDLSKNTIIQTNQINIGWFIFLIFR
jgi:hypothetical protein